MADISLDGSEPRSIVVTPAPTSTAGSSLTLEAGDATGPGDLAGGDLDLNPGAQSGAGQRGRVVVDGAIVLEQQQAGSPAIHGVADAYMEFSANGVGPEWGGTGMTCRQQTGGSFVALTIDDVPVVAAEAGMFIPQSNDAIDLGRTEGELPYRFRRAYASLFPTAVGSSIASGATIAAVASIHHVTGTAPVATITPPYSLYVGDVVLILDGNCGLATGGNIDPAAVEAANVACAAAIAVSGKAKVVLTFDGSTWY